jgi:trans-2,3-dihydro-3-hydroxyanthranilate isomerase
MPSRRYVVADVFTTHPYGGNQLAVVLDSEGLTTAQMLAITREFNFSESTFVLPPDDPAHTARVRIFTTACEVPFAGHPNVGTAYVLARMGELFGRRIGDTVLFEELAGIVPVSIQTGNGVVTGATLTAPESLWLGESFDVAAIAACLRLDSVDVLLERHVPREVSVGLPFVMVELTGTEALARSRLDAEASCALLETHAARGLHVYARERAPARAQLLSAVGIGRRCGNRQRQRGVGRPACQPGSGDRRPIPFRGDPRPGNGPAQPVAACGTKS